ncbi:hypothetical protein IHE30_10310 [Mycetohabitans sp. B46]
MRAPKTGSAAASILKGGLSPSGARAQDSHTVSFHLDAPNGNFPHDIDISPDNDNAGHRAAAHGKTTLTKVVLGVVASDPGATIKFAGRPYRRRPLARRSAESIDALQLVF